MTPLRWAIDLVLIAAGVVSVLFEPTSIAISSVLLIAVAVWHAWTRRDWLLRRRPRAQQPDSARVSESTASGNPAPGMCGRSVNPATTLVSAAPPTATLIEHWNGTAWTTVSSPNVGAASRLVSVSTKPGAAIVWAVGYRGVSRSFSPLALQNP